MQQTYPGMIIYRLMLMCRNKLFTSPWKSNEKVNQSHFEKKLIKLASLLCVTLISQERHQNAFLIL